MEKAGETTTLTIKFGVKSIAVSVPASSNVSDLMEQLQTTTDVLPRVQKLIFKGKVLTPDMTLKDAQLKNGSKIMLMAAQGFQSRFPVRSASPVKRKTSPPKNSLSSKQIPVKATQVDESRLKAWKLTGVASLRDSGLQVCMAARMDRKSQLLFGLCNLLCECWILVGTAYRPFLLISMV